MQPRIRLTLWYICFLAAVGAFHPYLAVVLDDAGASGAQQAAILSLFPLGSIFAGPGLTWLADRTGRSILVLRLSIGLTAVAAVTLAAGVTLWWMIASIALLSFARAPSSSIVDMLTAKQLGMGKTGYGGVRAWGSVGFIAAASGVGLLLHRGSEVALQVHAILLLTLVFLTYALPTGRATPPQRERGSIAAVLKKPILLSLYGVGILHQSTIAFYDHFFALHVTKTLDSGAWIASASIALGVGLEVIVLAKSHRLLQRFGPGLLIVVAIVSGVPRWILTASTEHPLLLILVQALHGLGFGAWWVGAIALVDRHAPGQLRNSAQGLFMASTHGLGNLVAMGCAWLLLDRSSTTAVFLSSGLLSAFAALGCFVFLLPALRRSTMSQSPSS